MKTKKEKARSYMQAELNEFESAFDLAVDCTAVLDLYTEDNFIPVWVIKIAEELMGKD